MPRRRLARQVPMRKLAWKAAAATQAKGEQRQKVLDREAAYPVICSIICNVSRFLRRGRLHGEHREEIDAKAEEKRSVENGQGHTCQA